MRVPSPDQPRRRALWLATAFVAVLLAVLSYGQELQQQQAGLKAQAELVARLSAASLVFDHAVEAHEVLGALGGTPAIVAATLRRPDGSRLAEFRRDGPAHGLEAIAGQSDLSVPVLAQDAMVGRLELQATRAPVWEAVALFMAGAWAVMGGSWLVAGLATRRMRREVELAQAHISFMAHHDGLTRLANREAFAVRLQAAVEQGAAGTLLMIDLDDFKQVNDMNGHAAGDHVLGTVARRLGQLVGTRGVVARQGGDEFAVLVRESIDAAEQDELAGAVIATLRQPMAWEGVSLQVRASVGIVSLPEDAREAEVAMLRADAALHQAKRGGKNQFARYSRDFDEQQRERQRLIADLGDALKRGDQLCLHYQPIFDGDGRLRSWEALSRWRHPVRGWVAPALFIPVAEASGQIVELGQAILQQVRADLDFWAAQGLDVPPVAINLSSQQFRRERDQAAFVARLQALELGPQRIEFELTESAVFSDLDHEHSVARRLQGLGYRLALDDFGTGYSSLGYLRRIRCDKLKIDRVFVAGIGRDREALSLVRAIIGVAKAMDMQVVAEGIESVPVQRMLVGMGCDLFQGFGLARPMAPQDASTWMADAAREDGDGRGGAVEDTAAGSAKVPRPH